MFANPLVTELIRKILVHQDIGLCRDSSERMYFDLNTGMKSHAYMYVYDTHLLISKRYGETTEIDLDQPFEEVWSDLIRAIESCAHGREYISYGWARHLEDFYG